MKQMKLGLSTAVVALSVSFGGAAKAQDEAEAAAEAPPTDTAEAPAEAEEAPAEEPKADAKDEAASEEEGGNGRFRFGVSGFGGPMIGEFEGGAGGVDLRFGWQLNNDYGIYAQPILIIGAGASASVAGASASLGALAGGGVLFEWTPVNFVYLGGGLEVLPGGFGSTGASTSGTATAQAVTGPFFSIPLRAGLALGSNKPDRRKAFTIGLDGHIVFTSAGPVIFPLLALGYDAF